MAELPFLPTATDALIADTTHMSAEEFGAYWRILCAMWRHGAKLVYDAEELARIAGVSEARWRAIEARVLAPITKEPYGSTGTILTQKRLTRTWLKVQTTQTKRALAGKKRWNR